MSWSSEWMDGCWYPERARRHAFMDLTDREYVPIVSFLLEAPWDAYHPWCMSRNPYFIYTPWELGTAFMLSLLRYFMYLYLRWFSAKLVWETHRNILKLKWQFFFLNGYRTLFFRIWLDGQLRKAWFKRWTPFDLEAPSLKLSLNWNETGSSAVSLFLTGSSTETRTESKTFPGPGLIQVKLPLSPPSSYHLLSVAWFLSRQVKGVTVCSFQTFYRTVYHAGRWRLHC